MGLPKPSRRQFLVGIVASGALLSGAAYLGEPYARRLYRRWTPLEGPSDPTAFVSVDGDGVVTLLCKHLEMGQGIMTGMATVVAEEMDADWAQMRVEHAPADPTVYQNLYYGRQVTAASSSIGNSWHQLRQIGAGARAMFVAAAAEAWGVPASEIMVASGEIRHSSGKEVGFGELAEAAMAQALPDASKLKFKDRKDWTLIGADQARIEQAEKLSGETVFGLDVTRPDMVMAAVHRAPRFGGKLVSYDASAAEALPGVLEIVAVPTGVAVLARDTWTAFKARDLITATWDDSAAETRSTDEIFDAYRDMAAGEGNEALNKGDAGAALAGAASREDLEFRFDYMPHAPLEPLNAVMERTAHGVTIWAGCQAQTLEQNAVSKVFGLTPQDITIHTQYAGSSFGRRVFPRTDWLPELAEVVKASTLGRPVQMVWTRRDDLAGGAYRPTSLHRAELGFDDAGALEGWRHRVVCQSLVQNTPWGLPTLPQGWDRASVGGLRETEYDLKNYRIEAHNPVSPVTVGFWRSVGDTHNGYVLETVVDIAAHRAGRDPYEYRMDLLRHVPREQRVVQAVAEAADWGAPMAEGRGRGISYMADSIYRQDTLVAMVAEVTVEGDGFTVDRLVVAVDCGIAINPDIVRAQVEGSISFGLSPALRRGVTLKDGIVEQQNFDTFEPTRLSDMPKIEIVILPSDESPSGIGEAAVAPVAPAIGNALFAATGTRVLSLPLRLDA